MLQKRLSGLIAAACTPLDGSGKVVTEPIKPLVDHLIGTGVQGLYVCGSTGEGISLSTEERMRVAEAYVTATDSRVPVLIQVGHNSTGEAKRLVEHACEIGADAISATCPSYFKVTDAGTLAACMGEIASAAEIPFYYYHIPSLTGSTIDMVQFLKTASKVIPTLVGLKYTDTKLFEFQACLELDNGRFDVVWGCDEMLLGALATGARAGIGSTYNIAAPLYRQIIDAVEKGDLTRARELQSRSVAMVRVMCRYPFHAALKTILTEQGSEAGFTIGGCRLPLQSLTSEQAASLKSDLDAIGFYDWSR
ncbi:dihydrodipicolinate synthase family protein [Stieleria sp. JC731]|uniref:dihydrodipicolinate synthase family protein n=1 Tax=Pirellulaceae TaxID=2691357 RepID=UPI001E638BB8|nr:dihydrodipicolinate synthase family protein [Stieleria sp. JC731]MCC9600745.1 dihydrodipicolinate synthase family protein [Stieleria sp. JC731]